MTSLEKRAQFSGRLMKISYLALILALSLSTWVWVQEMRQPSISIWLIRILPLLVFIVPVFRHQLKGIAWLCFVSLLYFTLAVTDALSPYALWINYIELGLVVVLFCSATAFIRWHARAMRAAQSEGLGD